MALNSFILFILSTEGLPGYPLISNSAIKKHPAKTSIKIFWELEFSTADAKSRPNVNMFCTDNGKVLQYITLTLMCHD